MIDFSKKLRRIVRILARWDVLLRFTIPSRDTNKRVREIIDNVNSNLQSNYLQIEALQAINKAVEKCDAPKLRQALLDPNLGLDNELKNELHGIGDDDAIHFLCLMRDFKSNLR